MIMHINFNVFHFLYFSELLRYPVSKMQLEEEVVT